MTVRAGPSRRYAAPCRRDRRAVDVVVAMAAVAVRPVAVAVLVRRVPV
ncbi:hypothetical protein J7F03_24790 [Streptomyces sp. ISL-43]|nr:hypothetical protein [Streptomyces sp. ISL-43]MBT2450234.1 hypothetical protein [Streptomyces sp. ISL-43]